MTTVINNPGNNEDSGGAVGMILGVVVLLVVVGLFFVYALPAIRNSGGVTPKGTLDVNVNVPAGIPAPAAPAPAAPAQ